MAVEESPSLFVAREIVRSDEEWTLMYEDGAGRWHELGSGTRNFVRKFALETKADHERMYPDDKYRLAIRTTIIEWPLESEEME